MKPRLSAIVAMLAGIFFLTGCQTTGADVETIDPSTSILVFDIPDWHFPKVFDSAKRQISRNARYEIIYHSQGKDFALFAHWRAFANTYWTYNSKDSHTNQTADMLGLNVEDMQEIDSALISTNLGNMKSVIYKIDDEYCLSGMNFGLPKGRGYEKKSMAVFCSDGKINVNSARKILSNLSIRG